VSERRLPASTDLPRNGHYTSGLAGVDKCGSNAVVVFDKRLIPETSELWPISFFPDSM
jgi:hypothetical protein